MPRDSQVEDEGCASEAKEQYEIRIPGALEAPWQQWFEGMTLQVQPSAEDRTMHTALAGSVKDQPALHGLQAVVRDLNLTSISVRRVLLDRQSNRDERQNDET